MPSIVFMFLVFATGIATFLWYQARKKYLLTKVNEQIKDKVILKIAVPRANQKSPLAAEQLFSALHGIGLNKAKSFDHFSLEVAAGNYGIHFICVVDKQYKTFVENQIYAQYPEAQIVEVQDYANSLSQKQNIQITELKLLREYYFPIRTFPSFEVDPLASITGAVSSLPAGHEVFIQIVARPIGDSWQAEGKKYVEGKRNQVDKEGKRIQLESGESDLIKLVETKNSKVGFQFIVRILATSGSQMDSQRLTNEVMAAFGQYRTAVFNSIGVPKVLKGWPAFKQQISDYIRKTFYGQRLGEKLSKLEKFSTRYLNEFTKDVVNTEELASLYHLPNISVETPNIAWAMARQLEYPLNLPTTDATILGETDYRGIHLRFGIRDLDRLRHMYIIGKTGTGKSTFMENLVLQDIYNGKGVGVIDPHGETIKHILEGIPPHREKDVIIFSPGDTEFPIALNLLEAKPGEDKSLITDGLVSVFKKEFQDSWGPRLEYILTNTFLTLLSCQNVSLLAVPRILSDDNYRKFLLKQLKDPILLKFWDEEYAQIAKDPRRKSEEISSILNKIGRFTTNPMMRNIVGQISSSINFRDIMDSGKILLINLAQGKVGEENMKLLGGMIVTRLYSNVVQRVDMNEKDRKPFYLYIDEFQNFSNPTFEKILSEARKYGLSLNIAHQFIDQIDEDVRNAVFGNVGTLVNFAVGPRDAEYLVTEYAPYLSAEDIVNLGKYRAITKLSIDQAQSKPFSMKTLAPRFAETNLSQSIIEMSRQEFGRERQIVQDKIYKWASQTYNKEGNLIQKDPGYENKQEKPKLDNPKSDATNPIDTIKPIIEAQPNRPQASAPKPESAKSKHDHGKYKGNKHEQPPRSGQEPQGQDKSQNLKQEQKQGEKQGNPATDQPPQAVAEEPELDNMPLSPAKEQLQVPNDDPDPMPGNDPLPAAK